MINEFSSNSSPEWVELFNAGSEAIDITGWKLSDEAQTPETLTGTIPANGYFVFEKASGWLNNDGGDTITLKDASDNIKESVIYGKSGSIVGIPNSDKSAGRSPNGSSSWINNLDWTRGSINPTVVPSPTPSPSPSPSLSPSPTPSPSPKPSVKPSIKPSPKPSPSPEVLGEVEVESPTPVSEERKELYTPEATATENDEKKIPLVAGGFVVGGLGLIGVAAYPFIKVRLSRYNKGDGTKTY